MRTVCFDGQTAFREAAVLPSAPGLLPAMLSFRFSRGGRAVPAFVFPLKAEWKLHLQSLSVFPAERSAFSARARGSLWGAFRAGGLCFLLSLPFL